MTALDQLEAWEVPHVAAAVVSPEGIRTRHGDIERNFALASVSKLLAAYAGLIALEEGIVSLSDPAGPPGSTVAHLLAHTAGYAFDGTEPITAPGRRRIYSNTGIEVFAEHLAGRAQMPFAQYLREAVLVPLGMSGTELRGSAAYGVSSNVADLATFARELLRPRLIHPATLARAVAVWFPGLSGVVPGVGRFDPCDWGLGFERNFAKSGHWAGTALSPEAFGHFGGSGTFLVIDPTRDRGVIVLTDRPFGPWALEVWPPLCDAIVADIAAHRS